MRTTSAPLIAAALACIAPVAFAGQISVVNPGTIVTFVPPAPTPVAVPSAPVTPTTTVVPTTVTPVEVDTTSVVNPTSTTPTGSTVTPQSVPVAAVQQFNPASLSIPQVRVAVTQIQAILASPQTLTPTQIATLQSHLAQMQARLGN